MYLLHSIYFLVYSPSKCIYDAWLHVIYHDFHADPVLHLDSCANIQNLNIRVYKIGTKVSAIPLKQNKTKEQYFSRLMIVFKYKGQTDTQKMKMLWNILGQ